MGCLLKVAKERPFEVTLSAKKRLNKKGTDRARDGVDLKNDMA